MIDVILIAGSYYPIEHEFYIAEEIVGAIACILYIVGMESLPSPSPPQQSCRVCSNILHTECLVNAVHESMVQFT